MRCYAPDGFHGGNHGGKTLKADKDGAYELTDAQFADLKSHGFRLADEVDAQKPPEVMDFSDFPDDVKEWDDLQFRAFQEWFEKGDPDKTILNRGGLIALRAFFAKK